jgi:hypothetical protein
VTVDLSLCGPEGATAKAGFASSEDIAWSRSPKLTQGQDAVLLLHPPVDPFATRAPEPTEVVIDPLDVHTMTDLTTVADLLADPPPLP